MKRSDPSAARATPALAGPAAARLAALALAAAAAAVHAADITVTVDNVQDGEGQVLIGLFDTAATFPQQVARGQAVAAATRDATGRVRVVISGVPPGTYAVSAVHDRNGNGKLDRNLLGIPTEPYGFSGRAAGRFGPPAFADAAVELPAAGSAIAIRIE